MMSRGEQKSGLPGLTVSGSWYFAKQFGVMPRRTVKVKQPAPAVENPTSKNVGS